ncbi:MAG: cobalt ECF transporter T component CbiQ [Anaerolineae bacterium]|nr:cobalt ECF transporter T component CbiQ [Anaerolineae bacterium]
MREAHRLDPYIPGSSPLHRADARLKLVGMLAYVLLLGAIPWRAWPAYSALAALAGAVWVTSGIAPRSLFRRVAPIVLFGGLAAVGALFQPGDHAYRLGRVLWLDFVVSEEGARQCGLLIMRSALSGALVAVYIAVTRFGDTVQALRCLGVPAVLTATLSFVYRYLFVLLDEAFRLDRARESRTLQPPSLRRLGAQVRTYARLVGTLFLRAYDRSERVHQAMLARGYTGEFRPLDPSRWTDADTRAGAIWAAALAAVALAVWL